MKRILTNWSFGRWLRLLIGVVVMVQAIVQKDPLFGLLAGFLLLTALANVGCCGAAGCAIDYRKTKRTKEIIYEEVDSKK